MSAQPLSVALVADKSGAIGLPFSHLLMALAIIVFESLAARYLQLQIADQLLFAGIRAFIQLNLLGYILQPIFAAQDPFITLAYIFGFMVLVSAWEAVARPPNVYPGIYRNAVLSIGGSLCVMMVVLLIIVAPTPWYNAQYLIPLAGMLINNALTGMAPALNMILDHLKTRKEHVETLLSFGATPWEAAWPGFTATFRQALIPSVNGMNVIGLVSIPGMMTGQVLGGSPPTTAARYQIVITFLISGTTFLTVWSMLASTIRSMFDDRGRLASHKLTKQSLMKVAQCCSVDAWKKRWQSRSTKTDKAVAGTTKKEPLLASQASADQKTQLCLVASSPQQSTTPSSVILDFDFKGSVAAAYFVHAKFQLCEGDIGCIMGPSGIGKSTLLKLISDLLPPTEGSMRLKGKDSTSYTAQAWRRDVLYMPQSKAALPDSPREFVQSLEKLRVNLEKPPLDPVPFMEAVGLDGSYLERPWGEISGGEAQRTMCAIALAAKPACLLLDEPTSALDDDSKRLVEAQLKASGITMLVVTHDEQQAARIATRTWRLTQSNTSA